MNSLESQYPFVNDCFGLEKQIKVIENDIDYLRKRFKSDGGREKLLKERKEYFFVLGCAAKVEAKRQSDTKEIFDKNAEIAKKRIEQDSIKTRNTIAYISAGVLLTALMVILINRKK